MRKACKPLNLLLAAAASISVLAIPAASWAQSISQIPLPPASPPPPHGPILIYAVFNWALVLLVIVLLVGVAIRTRSWFPIAFLVGSSLAAFTEPVFDGNIHVLFVYPPGTHPSWHFYNVPYPSGWRR